MAMKRSIIILTFSIIVTTLISCQPIYKAQKQMDKYNYAKAIVILKKAVDNEKTHDAALPMLADCYRLQRDILNAKSTYSAVVKLQEAKPESFLYYAQALQSTGDYEKAREMFLKYAEMNPTDLKARIYAANCDSILGPWKGLPEKYEVKIANGINTSQSDFGPVFYNEELVFASDFNTNPSEAKEYGWTGRGYLNIMKSDPDSTGNFWGNMQKATEFNNKINQEYHDGPATFSADGNSIYFTRSFFGKAKREGIYKTNLLKIYYANKTDGDWSEVKPFFLNSKEYSVGHPSLSADGKTLYFASDMPGGQGGTDIWLCKRDGDAWGPASNLGSIVNTSEKEMFPTICNDGVLYFASAGHPGYGALDIFRTKYENSKWTTPENLHTPLNGSYDDFAIAFAPGEKNGFFSSNRPEGMGSDDIYAFRVARPTPVLPALISGLVKDKTTMLPIADATVFLYNPTTGNVKILKTNTFGVYESVIDKPADYIVKAMMPNYISDCILLPVAELKPGITSNAYRDLLLDKLTISKSFQIEKIYYDFDKYTIRADAKAELDKLVRIMTENPVTVELGSYTDCRGSDAYNQKLSQNRADAAVKYIIKSGIDKSRITAKGYGEQQLVNKCADGVKCTSPEHQANRRSEFKITSISIPDAAGDQFDPALYKEGEDFDIKMFPADFFVKCK